MLQKNASFAPKNLIIIISLHQVVPNLYPVWVLSTKEDILKSVGNQTVDGSHWLPLYFFHTVAIVNCKLFGYQHSSKYLWIKILGELSL